MRIIIRYIDVNVKMMITKQAISFRLYDNYRANPVLETAVLGTV
jgi:hypothetical protein